MDTAVDSVAANAKAVFDSRTAGDVASLVFDSLVDANDGPEAHRLSFENAQLTVEVDVSISDDRVQIDAELQPSESAKAVLHRYEVDLSLVARVVGNRFSFGNVSHGLVRLSFENDTGDQAIYTDWFRI